jgi:excisionase family DNA binding protein
MTNLLTASQIAEYLGVPVSTVRKWCSEKFVPHLKVGRLVRFRAADVDRWLEKRSVPGRTKRGLPVL